MAAISILSSTAAFDRQCERAGLTAAWTDALRASGITSSTGLALLDCCRSCAGGVYRVGVSLSISRLACERKILKILSLSFPEILCLSVFSQRAFSSVFILSHVATFRLSFSFGSRGAKGSFGRRLQFRPSHATALT